MLLIGPTGAGKSSLVNALAGRRVSPSGVLRPTTREVVALVRPSDRAALLADGAPLPSLAGARLRVVEDGAAPEGIVLVDAPDVDSIEHANRDLTDRLAEAADLGVFVTTATRYADRVPWDVLVRSGIVACRSSSSSTGCRPIRPTVPTSSTTSTACSTGSGSTSAGSTPPAVRTRSASCPSWMGRSTPVDDGLDAAAVAPLRARIDALGRDREARRALAARALAGSLAGLAPLLEQVADDAEHEAIDADALRRVALDAWAAELRTLREDLGSRARSCAPRRSASGRRSWAPTR